MSAYDVEDTFLEDNSSPLTYFMNYFDDEFFQEVSYLINIYSLHTSGVELNTTPLEMKQFFGIHIVLGCVPFHDIKAMWGTFKIKTVTAAIKHKRFLKLRMNVQCSCCKYCG